MCLARGPATIIEIALQTLAERQLLDTELGRSRLLPHSSAQQSYGPPWRVRLLQEILVPLRACSVGVNADLFGCR